MAKTIGQYMTQFRLTDKKGRDRLFKAYKENEHTKIWDARQGKFVTAIHPKFGQQILGFMRAVEKAKFRRKKSRKSRQANRK